MTRTFTHSARIAASAAATFCLATFVSPTALSADVTFPIANGDLASTADWGQTPIPAATERPKFDKSGTVTASEDISFAGLYFNLYPNKATVFDMREAKSGSASRTVTLSDSITMDASHNNANGSITFQGGVWNVTGNLTPYRESTVTACDGARMAFSERIMPSAKTAPKIKFVFSGQGTAISAARASLQQGAGWGSDGNRLEVRDGATLTLTGGSSTVPALATIENNYASDMVFLVTGEGSTISISSENVPAWIGGQPSTPSLRHRIQVEDGGLLDISKGKISVRQYPGRTSLSNAVSATSGGTILAKTVVLGDSTGADQKILGNVFAVTNGGVAEVSGTFYVGSYSRGNTLLVENGTFRAAKIPVVGRYANDQTNVVRIAGADARFEAYTNFNATTAVLCWLAPNCRFELDGAKWTYGVAARTILYGGDNSNATYGHATLSLENGAEYVATGDFWVNHMNYAAPTNRVLVGSGSLLSADGDIRCYSTGNEIAVSHGVLQVGGNMTVTTETLSTQIGQNGANGVSVEGANGRIAATNGTFSIALQSTLRFGYPVEGYATGVVPVRAKAFSISSDSVIVVDGVAERIENPALHETEIVTLIETENGATIPDAVLAAANATLPERCRLRKSADGKSLLLKVAKDSATVLFIR